MHKSQPENRKERFKQGDLVYLINFLDCTASIVGYDTTSEDIIIPYSIEHRDLEIIVTSISKKAFSNSQIKNDVNVVND